MSKLMEDYGKEVAVEATIRSCKRHGLSENEILNEIRDEYGLTEIEAEAYLRENKKSA